MCGLNGELGDMQLTCVFENSSMICRCRSRRCHRCESWCKMIFAQHQAHGKD